MICSLENINALIDRINLGQPETRIRKYKESECANINLQALSILSIFDQVFNRLEAVEKKLGENINE